MKPAANSTESADAGTGLLDRLCSLDGDIVYFPVRHHSPACAALVARCIESVRPAEVLIEGPSDFEIHFDELLRDHELPIAIYSYFRNHESSSGAYYPFCEYSPEWVAIRTGRSVGAAVRFIDLPWSNVARHDTTNQRYADAELRRGDYIRALCDRMQVENFDDLWDGLFEADLHVGLGEYLRRMHSLCWSIRVQEHEVRVVDRLREAFMADMIRQARDRSKGRIVVVTGGFHSSALAARIDGFDCPGIDTPEPPLQADGQEILESGIALTTYSYERLDNLTGYSSGMPSPGFYEHAWRQRSDEAGFSHQPLLAELVRELRQRKQILSTADLIAVETSARTLAALRGRSHVWRRDLVDAVISALIKDELEYGCKSPFIDAVHAVLRGKRRGKLAEGTRVPPLVADIRKSLAEAGLEMSRIERTVELNLLDSADLAKSRLMHRLTILKVAGFDRVGGTDFLARDDLKKLWERWRLRWSPEFEATSIEAARYGTSIAEAAGARLIEIAADFERDAVAAAKLLVNVAQAGIETMSGPLLDRLGQLIHEEGQFASAATALGHLLFLYCFDEAFGTKQQPRVGAILAEAFARSLWLLESLGTSPGNDAGQIRGLQAMLDTIRRAGQPLKLDTDEFVAVLQRVEGDQQKPPQVRGACAGILWTLGSADDGRILMDLMEFADADRLGDFLTGLFALAREVAQRDPELVSAIDRLLLDFGVDDFMAALPSLRMAFTFFTPREKHHMLTTLFRSLGIIDVEPLTSLTVDASTAAEALAVEERIMEAIAKYDVGGVDV